MSEHVVKMYKNGQIRIPSDIRNTLNLDRYNFVHIKTINGNKIEIIPIEVEFKDYLKKETIYTKKKIIEGYMRGPQGSVKLPKEIKDIRKR